MKAKLDTENLIGEKVFIDGWHYDNSGTLLDGIIVEVSEAKDKFGRLAYSLKTKDNAFTLEYLITDALIKNGFYKANRLLNAGTNAVILTKNN